MTTNSENTKVKDASKNIADIIEWTRQEIDCGTAKLTLRISTKVGSHDLNWYLSRVETFISDKFAVDGNWKVKIDTGDVKDCMDGAGSYASVDLEFTGSVKDVSDVEAYIKTFRNSVEQVFLKVNKNLGIGRSMRIN